jgi:hypothetical protein
MSSPIPQSALTQHIIALGKTGSGKSSKLRVLVEQLLERDAPVCIIDPKGDWWGLKSSADGKRSGYPIVIFGGEHADVPLNAHAGAQVAELVATGNRSCLIDLGGWMVGERTRFFIDFAAALFKLSRGARHLVIDEVHNFAPQGKILDPDAGKMLHWANRLASEGRGKGLTIIAASQRPQKVHKDFLTSCETLIACKVIHKLDRDSIKDWIDGCADPAKGREVLASLAQMKKPEAWCWSPEIDFGPELVTFPMFKTYDSFKPQAADVGKLAGWATVDLDQVKAKLATVLEQAKKNDPAELRNRIAELERQVKTKTDVAPNGYSKEHLNEACDRAERDAAARAGRRLATDFSQALSRIEQTIVQGLTDFARDFRKIMATEQEVMRAACALPLPDGVPKPAAAGDHARRMRSPVPARAAPAAERGRKPASGSSSSLPQGERATLAACIQYPEGLARSQLTVLTGYKRSSRDTYIQRLRERAFVITQGDRVVATDDGIAAMPDAEPLPRGKDLQDFWMSRLPDGERKVLAFLINSYPDAVERSAIDEATGYQRSSRDTYLQRMRAKQLVVDVDRGHVRAAEILFE